MFTAIERLPLEELTRRHALCRALLAKHVPSAGGMLITGAPNLYYMTGTAANGLAWLPLEGEMVLAVRKGIDRARLESPLATIATFHSYRDILALFAENGSPLTPILAVDQAGLTWKQGCKLQERMPEQTFLPGDAVIARARAVKSAWELAKMRTSCRYIAESFEQLRHRIRPGMSEYGIAHMLWNIFLDRGHTNAYPTGMPGSTVTLGHICVGNNGNYPSAYDGPLGVKGVHPAAPTMGNRQSVWQKGEVLVVDSGFNWEGYISDKTQTFFAGRESEVPAEIRKVHDVTMVIAEKTAEALRPGITPSAVYALSLDIAKQAGYGQTFMGAGRNQVRFLGHGIGLTVSEWPIFAKGFDDPLEPGMTMALEPKIALPGIAMVGVENTYEITETGAVCLTGGIRDIICLE